MLYSTTSRQNLHTVEHSLLDQLLTPRQEEPPSPRKDSQCLVGECLNARHPTLVGRVLVGYEDGHGHTVQAWLPTLQGLSVRTADRVLLMHPSNWPEPVVSGVVDGFAKRPEPLRTPAVSLPLCRDETVQVTTAEGEKLLEIYQAENGPVVRLWKDDVDLDFPGRLRIAARSIEMKAVTGSVRIQASDDVSVEGEMINLN